MKSAKDLFKALILKAYEWRIWKGYPVKYEELSPYRREVASKEIGRMVTDLPKNERLIIKELKAKDMDMERYAPPYEDPPPKRQRNRAIRLVVNNDKDNK